MKNFKFNLFSKLFMFSTLIGTIIVIIFNYKESHFLTYCMALPIVLVPFLLKKTIFCLDDIDTLIYNIFTFFAYFLGCVVSLYNITWWYDLLMHFVSGFAMGHAAMFILRKLKMYDCKNNLFNFIYCLFFTIGAAGMWEIGEYVVDLIIGTNLQHNLDTGVVDTMQDLICGTISGFIFSLIYSLKINSKKSAK